MNEKEKLEKRISGLGKEAERQIEEKRAASKAFMESEAKVKAARAKERADRRLKEDRLKKEFFKRR